MYETLEKITAEINKIKKLEKGVGSIKRVINLDEKNERKWKNRLKYIGNKKLVLRPRDEYNELEMDDELLFKIILTIEMDIEERKLKVEKMLEEKNEGY